ncbi:MAG: RDD family protein [Myxococcota bacterium]|jgi:uncharacterized RDD family membrane protein YckC|nr:RDD family protein [Myxococcota bacterium]
MSDRDMGLGEQGHDPYQTPASFLAESAEPPVATVEEEPRLADRSSRLGAQILDGLIMSPLTIGLFAAMSYSGDFEFGKTTSIPWHWTVIGLVVGLGAWLAVNGHFVRTRGQTLGKMAVGVRIVRAETGELAPLARIFGLRVLPVSIITQIPYVGNLIALVDVLFIFRDDKRCLHDLVAGTKVVSTR